MDVNGPDRGRLDLDDSSPTGITELDRMLGGGIPKGSVLLLAGSSGSGKTIFALKWLFEGVRAGEKGIYMTLTEPLFRSLKNLECMSFFDREAVEQERLKIIDLRETGAGLDPKSVLAYVEEEVRSTGARRLCVDSVTAIAYNLDDKSVIRKFIFDLGKTLATLGCTTILTSEVAAPGRYSMYDVEEFISDAIIRLDQVSSGGEMHRVMQVVKVRGRPYESEEILFKITGEGDVVYPRMRVPLKYSSTEERISTGNPTLDGMLTGGVFRGSTTLVAGATGTGKSLLSLRFILEGLKLGERCLFASFEESREQILRNGRTFGWDLEGYERNGLLMLRCRYPKEKYLEEHLSDIRAIIEGNRAERCAIDSLTSISHSFPKDEFGEFAKTLNGYLKSRDVTTFFTSATSTLTGSAALSEGELSTMTDNIIMLRHIEMDGQLRLVLNIIKARGSAHSKDLRVYDITADGLAIGQPLSGYEGVTTGVSRKVSSTAEERLESEFRRFLGPMAPSVLARLGQRGLTPAGVAEYVDSLKSEGILKDEEASEFKKAVMRALEADGR
jgi:circadian clock protein KaiC